MIAFFANIFGYILNFIYNIVGNYGWSIIIFCILIKVLMIPLSIKQQRTMVKSTKIQEKMKEIQFKYKNNPEKLNQETMLLYKNEKMSPFSGCFSAIIQLILLLSVFYLVRMPLTYMKNIDEYVINKYYSIMQENNMVGSKSSYSEIEIIREIENLKKLNQVEDNKEDIAQEEIEQDKNTQIIEEVQNEENKEIEQNEDNTEIIDAELDEMYINMEFLGLDLGQIPTQNMSDWKVFIIPVLYVAVSFISMKITTQNQVKKQKNKEEQNETEKDENEKSLTTTDDPMEAMNQANKSMSMIFPIMYLSVALIAPLGLALYWLVNSLLMIIERLILNKFISNQEEE